MVCRMSLSTGEVGIRILDVLGLGDRVTRLIVLNLPIDVWKATQSFSEGAVPHMV